MCSNNPENNAPVGDGTNHQPGRSQTRQPRNLQGLLRFAMEATKAEDAPGNSEFSQMDEESRKFLEEALRSLTVDMAAALQDAIRVLTDAEKINGIQLGQPLPGDVQTAFNSLLDFTDNIDIANDFYKMGGFSIFPVCYGSENEDVRARASSVLAELCQNNPFCQARALESGLLNVLLNLVHTERGNALAKCLYAISCTTREFEPACRELIDQGGCETLTQLLTSPEPAVRTKAAFLIRYLCHHRPEAKEKFIEQNLVKTIAAQIKAGRDETTEHLLSILMALIEGMNPTILSQCRDPNVGLRNILEEHLKHPDLVDDQFFEEKDYCQELLTQVFEGCPPVEAVEDEIADR